MVFLSGGKSCIEILKRQKVELLFGLPGGAVLPFYDDLRDSGIRHILTRHEQGAAHMADGFARATGRVGVCVATSGPGATNMVTGIATAYMDSSPMVVITGQVPRSMVGRDAFQEADVIGITHSITKHNYQPLSPSDVPWMVKAAFHIASTGRPGPVLVDIPRDVQVGKEEVDLDREFHLPGYNPPIEPHPLQLKKTCELLLSAEKPVILAGGGILLANASQELLRLSEMLNIPVATTFLGKGAFPERHPLALGKIGLYGGEGANHAISEADVILAVGVRFSDRSVVTMDKFARGSKIIHVDVDPSEIGKNIKVDIPMVSDAKLALKGILDIMAEHPKMARQSTWLTRVEQLKEEFNEEYEDYSKINSPRILKDLRRLLPDDAVATADVGLHQMWAAMVFDAYYPRSFISSGGLGPMGFAFPAAIGAKAARPDVPVVCITGDGGFQMTMCEMATSITEKIPIITVVFNNRSLGMVWELQKFFWNQRYFAVDLGNTPDFVRIAQAYGAQGFHVESYEEFHDAVEQALKSDVSVVIDVPIPPDEILPMVPPGRSLDEAMLEG